MLVSFISALNASWLQKNLSATLITPNCTPESDHNHHALHVSVARSVGIAIACVKKGNLLALLSAYTLTHVQCPPRPLSDFVKCIYFMMHVANTLLSILYRSASDIRNV